METLQIPQQSLPSPTPVMNTFSANFRTRLRFTPSQFRAYCASSVELKKTHEPVRVRSNVRVKVSEAQLKENWLSSLSCPLLEKANDSSVEPTSGVSGLEWMIGVDPDVSGALALLKSDDSGSSVQVFDTPHLQVLVGKRVRKCLDAKSIVQLLRSFDAPPDSA